MKRRSVIRTILAAITGAGWNNAHAQTISFVEYLGERIPLTKTYRDFYEYKNDPSNLTDASIRRVEVLMRRAPFGPKFSSVGAFDQELDRLQFPGYGMFYANQLRAKPAIGLELVYVEFPGGRLNRYFALAGQPNGALEVVADFVAPQAPEITGVRRDKSGSLEYTGSKEKVIIPDRR